MTDALNFLSQPETLPFATALALMVLLGAVSVIGLDFDVGADTPAIDVDVDANAGSAAEGLHLIDWLNPGRIPVMAALALFLMIYGLIGLIGQQALDSSTGMLPAWLAALVALPAAYIAWQPASPIIGKIMPRDHTDAISLESLKGRRAVIDIGTATHTSSARATVRDVHGTRHSVMVVMSLPSHEAHAGDEVYLLEIGRDGEPSIAHPAEPRSVLSL